MLRREEEAVLTFFVELCGLSPASGTCTRVVFSGAHEVRWRPFLHVGGEYVITEVKKARAARAVRARRSVR
jgi:hypothetical protein